VIFNDISKAMVSRDFIVPSSKRTLAFLFQAKLPGFYKMGSNFFAYYKNLKGTFFTSLTCKDLCAFKIAWMIV